MGQHTDIQWCDGTINPTSGCDGCELYVKPPAHLTGRELAAWLEKQPCYAGKVHRLRLAPSFPDKYGKEFSEVRTIPGRMLQCESWSDLRGKNREDKPWLTARPRMIFVSDMADALSDAVPFEYLRDEIVKSITTPKMQARGHQFLWLTKRPARMAQFAAWLIAQGIEWPANLWAGTSVTNNRTFDLRVPELLKVPARRFLSVEPLREELQRELPNGEIALAIIGGESGPNAKAFDVAWARSFIERCRRSGAHPFVKQLGANAVATEQPADWKKQFPQCVTGQWKDGVFYADLKDGHGGDWNEWPWDIRVREYPA